MEDLAAFTTLDHLGSFGKNFVKFKKNKNVIYRLRVGPFGENCDRGLTVGLGQHFQDLDHSFSRPRSQFFTMRTSQPANNIYLFGDQLFDTLKVRLLQPRPPRKIFRKLTNIVRGMEQ